METCLESLTLFLKIFLRFLNKQTKKPYSESSTVVPEFLKIIRGFPWSSCGSNVFLGFCQSSWVSGNLPELLSIFLPFCKVGRVLEGFHEWTGFPQNVSEEVSRKGFSKVFQNVLQLKYRFRFWVLECSKMTHMAIISGFQEGRKEKKKTS